MSKEVEALNRLKQTLMQRHGYYQAVVDRLKREKAEAELVAEELMHCMFAIDAEISALTETVFPAEAKK